MEQQQAGPNGHVYSSPPPAPPSASSAARWPASRPWSSAPSAIRAAVERPGCPADAPIDEVIMGQVLQAGVGQAPARQALLRQASRTRRPATTINRVCGSGLKAIMFAAAGHQGGRR